MNRLRPLALLLALSGCQATTIPPDDIGVLVLDGLFEGSRSVEPFHVAVLQARRAEGIAVSSFDARSPSIRARPRARCA